MKKSLGKIDYSNYRRLAMDIRRDVLYMIYTAGGPHIGSSFSIVEILISLYYDCMRIYPKKPDSVKRDRFILSKGHGCPALYAVLSKRGFFGRDVLSKFAVNDGLLEQHPTRNTGFGIEVSSGSLGHGLSVGAGMAFAGKNDKLDYKTFVLLSDGELDEGSTWEAAMFASHHRLDNLVAIVDYNKLQATGRKDEIVNVEPLADKWRSFGWEVREVDGHDFGELIPALRETPFRRCKPSVLIAHTIKGKGVSFMENKIIWHYRAPSEEEYKKALKELE